METVFIVLAICVGLFLVVSLAPLLLTFIWIVIPAVLTIGVIGALVYLLWRNFRPERP